MELEPVVVLDHKGRRFTFRIDRDPPLAFWRVESEGRIYRAPARVLGDEQRGFFAAVADVALREWNSSR
jgi:hypothetical protein